MKLKKPKKLQLNRETLTQLDQLDLQRVAGGATATCPDVCYFSNGRNTCTTCNLTCTTNLC